MTLPKLEGHITVPTGGWSISVTEDPAATSSVTVAAGSYWLTSTTSLVTALVTALNANGTLSGTYAATVDDTSATATGKVTISVTGVTTFAITWTSTSLRNALGWTGNTSAAASVTSQSSSPYIYLPNVVRTNTMAPDGYKGQPVTDGTVTVSPSGTSKGITYATRYVDNLEFRFLLGSKTWRTWEVVTNESLQSFYETTIGYGCPLRYHKDRSDDTTYVSYRSLAVGSMSASAAIAGWTGNAASLWHYGPTSVVEYVAS